MFWSATGGQGPTANNASSRPGRRQVLDLLQAGVGLLAAAALARTWPLQPARAFSRDSHIAIDLPLVFEDGNSVPLAVQVDSPMIPTDHVREVHIVAPGNPLPEIARFRFFPQCSLAEVRTRIRLDAGLQRVVVTARFSDGTVQTASAQARITVGGCSTS